MIKIGDRIVRKSTEQTGFACEAVNALDYPVRRWMYFDDGSLDAVIEESDMERILTPADIGNHIDFQATKPELHAGDRVRHETLGEGKLDSLNEIRGVGRVYLDNTEEFQQTEIALSLLTKVEVKLDLRDQVRQRFGLSYAQFDELRDMLSVSETLEPEIERPSTFQDVKNGTAKNETQSLCAWCQLESTVPCEGCGTIREDRHTRQCPVDYATKTGGL